MTRTRTALVLVDLQRWIVDMPWQPGRGDAVVDACTALRAHFAKAGSPVVVVRYVRADGADGGVDAAPNRLVPGIEPNAGDLLVTKNGLDAFQGTGLQAGLQASGVTRLVLAGLSTAHGVASTAATAVEAGYEVVVVSDATSSVTGEEHQATLDRLAGLGVRISSAEEVLPEPVTGS